MEPGVGEIGTNGREVVLWVDTFNTYHEPENARAALNVLRAAGYTVHVPTPVDGGRPVCCGRTFLSVGQVHKAKAEAVRLIEALRPYAERGIAIVGLEPSCVLSLRDEFTVMFDKDLISLIAEHSVLFEEFLISEQDAGRLELPLQANRF